MYILNIVSATKGMSVNEFRDFIFENYYKRIGFAKERSYYSMKPLKKRFVAACNQINRKKYLIVVILKNTINNLEGGKTQNQ